MMTEEKHLWRVDHAHGMSILCVEDANVAKSICRKMYGDAGSPYSVRLATQDDTAFYKGMGGEIIEVHRPPLTTPEVHGGPIPLTSFDAITKAAASIGTYFKLRGVTQHPKGYEVEFILGSFLLVILVDTSTSKAKLVGTGSL